MRIFTCFVKLKVTYYLIFVPYYCLFKPCYQSNNSYCFENETTYERVITFPNGLNVFSPCFLDINIKLLILLFLEITWKLPIHTSASSLSFTVMIRDLEKLLNTSCPFLPNAFNGLSELGDTLLSVVVIHSSLINFVLSKPFVSKHPCSSVVVSINSTDRKTYQVKHYTYICTFSIDC